jgi:hypothetical protein
MGSPPVMHLSCASTGSLGYVDRNLNPGLLESGEEVKKIPDSFLKFFFFFFFFFFFENIFIPLKN